MVLELLALVPGVGLLILANYSEKRKELRILTRAFLLLTVLLVILEGLVSVALSGTDLLAEMGLSGGYGYGAGLFLTGLLSLTLFLDPVREWLAGLIDIEAENWLHATAMVFAVLVVGVSVSTAINFDLVVLGGGISTISIVIQDILFVTFAVFGVGFTTRRDWRETLRRLGLRRLSWKELGFAISFLGLMFLVVLAIGLGAELLGYDSGILDTEEDPTVQLIGGITVLTAIIYSIGAGIGEELLFRGAMQPRFGILLTSIIFALVHIQYPGMLQIATLIGLSVVLGYERKVLNTTACVITHTLYDLLLMISVALA